MPEGELYGRGYAYTRLKTCKASAKHRGRGGTGGGNLPWREVVGLGHVGAASWAHGHCFAATVARLSGSCRAVDDHDRGTRELVSR